MLAKSVTTPITFLFLAVVYSVHSVTFLSSYYSLVRENRKVKGVITSFDRANALLLRSTVVPIVYFKTEDNSSIEGTPEYSTFWNLNDWKRQDEVVVCYREDNPEKFVIISETDVWANWAVIGFTFFCLICSLIW